MAWTLRFSDAFTGTTGTTLPVHDATWSLDEGSMDINGNRVRSGGQSRSSISTSLAANQAVELAMYSDGDFHGVGCRYTSLSSASNDANAYWAFWNGGTIYLYKLAATSFSLIASTSKARSDGDVLRIEATGTGTVSLQVLVNGSTTGCPSGTDSSSPFNSGQAALRSISATFGDDFAAYDDAGVSGAVGPVLSGRVVSDGRIFGGSVLNRRESELHLPERRFWCGDRRQFTEQERRLAC